MSIGFENAADGEILLVLEPWGEIYAMKPGEELEVRRTGGPEIGLSVVIGEGEVKLWAQDPTSFLELVRPD